MCTRVDPGTLPVEAHLAHMRLRGLAETTIYERGGTLARLVRFLSLDSAVELLAVTEDDLDRWQYGLVPRSARYRATSMSHVCRFYRWAQSERLVRDDPSRVLVAPKLPRLVPRPMDALDLDTAISCAPARIRPMLVLAAYAGLRAGEIARLQRQHVMDTQRVLRVEGKGGRERIVPLSDVVLGAVVASAPSARGHVIPRHDGGAGGMKPHMVSKLCNDYLHSIGIEQTLHSLRHYFGSALYAASQDIRLVQEVMGHQSPTTTAGYVSYSHSAAVVAVKLVGAGLAVPGVPSVVPLRAVAD